MTYLEGLKRPPKLTRNEEFELFTRLRRALEEDSDDTPELLERVILQYIHWATYITLRTAWGLLDEDEAASMAAEALTRTAKKFRPDGKVRFCTYAKHRVHGMAMSYAIEERARRRANCRPVDTLKDQDREPNKFNHDDIQHKRPRFSRGGLEQLVEASDIYDRVDVGLKSEVAKGLLGLLSDLERRLIVDHYVIGYSYRELARRYGKSHEKIRLIVRDAVSRIRVQK